MRAWRKPVFRRIIEEFLADSHHISIALVITTDREYASRSDNCFREPCVGNFCIKMGIDVVVFIF